MTLMINDDNADVDDDIDYWWPSLSRLEVTLKDDDVYENDDNDDDDDDDDDNDDDHNDDNDDDVDDDIDYWWYNLSLFLQRNRDQGRAAQALPGSTLNRKYENAEE